MAIDVTFWTVSKKKNSTAVPGSSDSSTTHKCELNQPCSVEKPVIVLRNGGGVPGWNYCRILAFGGRYYWVNDWEYRDNCWYGSLSVDVLGSYRADIAKASFYILRSSTSFDGDVVDYLYPAKATPQKTRTNVTDGVFQIGEYGLSQGYYVCSIVGEEGLTNFYAFTPANFKNFCKQIFANIDWAQNDAQQIGNSVLKCLFNPFQYITGCIWLPLENVGSGTTKVNEIKFGFWAVNTDCVKLGSKPVFTRDFTMPVSQHPQISRGTFLNGKPFRHISVQIDPWGKFDIDSNRVGTASELNVREYVDCMTGVGYLSVGVSGQNLVSSYCQLGVPIQVSDLKTNLIDTGMNLLSSIGSFASGNFLGGLNGIGNAVDSITPNVNTKGASGSILPIVFIPSIDHAFYLVTDEDRTDNGRPYMKNGTFSALGSGYYVVENGAFNLQHATANEKEEIKSILESGVYYE